MRTIRASEIGAYLFCQRAWWYQKQGASSENLPEMSLGTQMHSRHGKTALSLGCLRFLALALLILALALASVSLIRPYL